MTYQPLSIVNTLQSKGWQTVPSNGGWLLSRDRSEGVIQMSITPRQWLCLATPLTGSNNVSALAANPGEQSEIYRQLLEQNTRMYMTKAALDKEGNLLLMTEVAIKDIDPLLAYWAVESIAHYKTRQQTEVVGETEQAVLGETELAVAEAMTEENARVYTTVQVRIKSIRLKPPDVIGGVADDTIKLFLDGIRNYGWRVKDKLEGFSWHLLFQGHYRYFDVFLTSSRTWLYFQVPILYNRGAASVLTSLDASMDSQEVQELRKNFLKYLLRLNQSWFMAKAGISTDDQVLLLLEVPTQALDFALFREATRTIGLYLNRFEQEIQIIASLQENKRLFELLRMSKY